MLKVACHHISMMAWLTLFASLIDIVLTYPIYFLLGEAGWYSTFCGIYCGPALAIVLSVSIVGGLYSNGNIKITTGYEKYL